MFSTETPPIVQAAPQNEQSDVIEVVGTRPGQVQKIDRRTYSVQQNPHTQQKDSIQLLRGLPAVTITPDDQIMILGAQNVTVQVDGRQVTTPDIRAYLRTLHGSDIERIEIVTNPSAQYSAEGTGGIINFVLRKKRTDGTSGTGSAEASSYARIEANGSLKIKKGKWIYELMGEARAGRFTRSTFHKLRSVESAPDGPATINTEDGGGSGYGSNLGLGGKVTYEIDPNTSVSAQVIGGAGRGRSNNESDFVGITPGFESFEQRQRLTNSGDYLIGILGFDHKGSKDGETLTASSQIFGNPQYKEATDVSLSDGSSFDRDTRVRTLFADSQVDWVHPIGEKQILSMGGRWKLQDLTRRDIFVSSGFDDPQGPETVNQYSASSSTLAAYVTFQQKIGTWTIMPGLRIEHNGTRVTSPGQPGVRVGRTNVFPTFHLEHPLSKVLVMTLSYSKRIDRPNPDAYLPYPIVLDALAVRIGNPDLRDQSTDSYEINLHYHRKKLDVGLIVYDREISGLWSNVYSVNEAGQSVSSTINSGRQRDSGAEIDVSTPIVGRVKATASINLFNSRVPIDTPSGRSTDSTFRYTVNSTIEWDGPNDGDRPGDVAQLQLQYWSPSRDFQFRDKARLVPTASYTHSFTKTLSMTAQANGFGPMRYRHRLLAPLVQEDYEKRDLPEFKLKLVKSFGQP